MSDFLDHVVTKCLNLEALNSLAFESKCLDVPVTVFQADVGLVIDTDIVHVLHR